MKQYDNTNTNHVSDVPAAAASNGLAQAPTSHSSQGAAASHLQAFHGFLPAL